MQASPEAADAAETVCSLTFASRVRGVELNAARRKADVVAPSAAAVVKAALSNTTAPPSTEGKMSHALRAATTPNLDACKAIATSAAPKAVVSALAARVTPRHLDKEIGAVAGQAQVRRSLDKENGAGGE